MSICYNLPCVYITDDRPVLDDIFSIDSATGAVTVDATGHNLVAEGVPLGVLTVSQ